MVKAGISLPAPWQEIPVVRSLDGWYMEAFGELSTCRAVGMDLGAIPWTAIVQYADRQRVDREEDFLYIMRAMDCAYLKFVKTQREKK